MHIRTEGLVLRITPVGDRDAMLTVMTRAEGKLGVRARGYRKGKIAASSQLLAYSDMQLFEHRGHITLDEAEPLYCFEGLRKDLRRFAAASYIAELCGAVCEERQPQPETLDLTLNAFYALSGEKYPVETVKAGYELRLMRLSGFLPSLEGCDSCGAEDGLELYCENGAFLCDACAAVTPVQSRGVALTAGTLAAMRHIASCGPRQVFSFICTRELETLCERYALSHADRKFKTLDFYKTLGG